MLRKLRPRQKNGFLAKKTCISLKNLGNFLTTIEASKERLA